MYAQYIRVSVNLLISSTKFIYRHVDETQLVSQDTQTYFLFNSTLGIFMCVVLHLRRRGRNGHHALYKG